MVINVKKVINLEKIDRNIIIGFFLNVLLGAGSFVVSGENSLERIVLWIIVFVVNVCFVGSINRNQIPVCLILAIWQWTLMLEIVYRMKRYVNTPFEIMYVFDIIALVYSISCLARRIRSLDLPLILLLILIVYCILVTAMNNSNWMDCGRTLILILRFVGIFIYFSGNDFEVPKWCWYIYAVTIAAFVAELLLGIPKDFRNGIFGYEYAAAMMQFVITAAFAYFFCKYIKRQIKINIVLILFLVNELIYVGAEQKAEIIMFPIWCVIVVLLSRMDRERKALASGGAIVGMSCIWTITTIIYPQFLSLSNTNALQAIMARFNGIGSYKMMAQEELWNLERSTLLQKIFGNGTGISLPPRYVSWVINTGKSSDELLNILKFSDVYEKYSNTYRYFSSNYINIVFDIGFVGIALLLIIFMLLLFRSVYLFRYGEEFYDILLGSVGIWQGIELGFRTINNMILINPLSIAVSLALYGMISRKYNLLMKNDLIMNTADL